ncbi:MAG: NAD(P)H-dependent glycerol-3-phosphate dehydrogenase [Candidatus Margulisiibacteriota bacterium]|nr:NAD(P)H-dependent glycerol-3-phosphate dehydrogenase [Candidatus Margulisiibacteriota bacterium]
MVGSPKKISVVGAGAWGTTLAMLFAKNGNQVKLWIFEKELAKEISDLHENKKYLPGFKLPDNISITADPGECGGSDINLFVVPTQFLRSVAKTFSRVIDPETPLVSASKGIEKKSLKLPMEILQEELKVKDVIALSGPNLSKEIAKGLPAATVVASENIEKAKLVQGALMQSCLRVYTNTDALGAQIGGALKNIMAIAAGVADGLELGDNAKSTLYIRGIAEISRLGISLGANAKTFSGLSGIGDLITTCSSRLSRNHRVGEQIAKGKKLPEIIESMVEVAEGIPTTQAALELGKKQKITMPITNEVNNILYKDKDPHQAITDLMTRAATSE